VTYVTIALVIGLAREAGVGEHDDLQFRDAPSRRIRRDAALGEGVLVRRDGHARHDEKQT
jgi:hypothetical protein